MGLRGDLVRYVAVAAAYYATAWAGIHMAVFPETVSPVWPATGVAVAALTWAGLRAWPAVAVAAFAVEWPAFGWDGAALVAIGNTLEAVAAAWALRRLGGAAAFESPRGVAGFLLAMALAPVASAATGTWAVSRLGGPTPLLEVAGTWYLGDVMGGLIVVPALLLSLVRAPVSDRGLAEAAAFAASTVVLAMVAFFPWRPIDLESARIGFIAIVPVAWAATRFGPLVTAWTSLSLAAAAQAGLVLGSVPLFGSPNLVLLQMQALTGLMSTLGLVLAANVFARSQAFHLLEEKHVALQEALLAVERSQQAKSSFLNKASHEMATPLTPMRLQAHILSEAEGLTTEERDAAQAIERNAERLAQLVDKLVDAARMDQVQVEPIPVPTKDIVTRIHAAWEDEASQRGVRLSVDADDHVVLADRLATEKALGVLVRNAIQHAPEDSEVKIRGWRIGRKVEISVEDTGEGVAADDRERLFEAFAEASKVQGTEGTGLGLYIARALVTAQGGDIHYEDGADGGARFVVSLPAASGPGEA